MTPDWPRLAVIGAGVGFGVVVGVAFWRSCRNSDARWSHLILDEATGKTSSTKVGALVAIVAVTVIFLRAGWNTAPGDGLTMLILVYYGLATGSQFASKLVGARFGASVAAPGTVTTETKLEEKKTTVAVAPAVPVVPVASPEPAANPSKGATP